MQSLPVDFPEERGLVAMVLSGFYVIFPLVRVHPLVSQVNQLTVVLLCSLMIPLRRYNFNEKREETTGFIEALGRRKTRPPQSRNRLRGEIGFVA